MHWKLLPPHIFVCWIFYSIVGTRRKTHFWFLIFEFQHWSWGLVSPDSFLKLFILPDISQARAAGPAQPILKTFPRTQHGQGRTRAFNTSWFKVYTWLEYSQCQDSAYCFACRHSSLPSAPDTMFTSGTGFSNWKKAMYKDGGFQMHAKAENHLNAMVACTEYKRGVENNTSLLQAMDKQYQKKVEENRKYIRTIADVLLCTATQNTESQRTQATKGTFWPLWNWLPSMTL